MKRSILKFAVFTSPLPSFSGGESESPVRADDSEVPSKPSTCGTSSARQDKIAN